MTIMFFMSDVYRCMKGWLIGNGGRRAHPFTLAKSAFSLPRLLLRACLPIACGLTAVSCSNGPTAPTTTTSTTSTSGTMVTEVFTSTLPVGGSRFYSFHIAASGSVTATLTDVEGDGVPASVVVNMGIGTPAGTTCTASATPVQVTGAAGVTTQVTATEQPGTYCVIVSDVGNLFSPATFTVSLDHP